MILVISARWRQLIVQRFLYRKSFPTSNTDKNVRVRFAPSPTGHLHLGGLRTALYNYLFAKSNNGVFVLRIEDTDQSRLVEGAIKKLESDLHWAGIDPDEGPTKGGAFGPYLQSQRLNLYRKEVEKLIETGHAYHCFCQERRLDILRRDAVRRGENPKYDNHCRLLSAGEVKEKFQKEVPFCIRFKLTPITEPFDDIIYGHILRNIIEIEGDPVILKTDGFPTYHFANVVDDHYMNITHVLRGVEWQVSTPKHILMYQAFNWKPPQYAHLPLLVNEDGTKLSKRHGDMTVEAYRKKCIYPNALLNVLVECGGGFANKESPDTTRRLLTVEDLCRKFSLKLVNANNCQLPIRKLKDFNSLELKRLVTQKEEVVKLVEITRELIIEALPETKDNLKEDKVRQVLMWSISNNRITSLPDLLGDDFLFLWIQPEESFIRSFDQELFESLVPVLDYVNRLPEIEPTQISTFLKDLAERHNLNYAKFMKFLRACLSGLKKGPPVTEILMYLGKDESLRRLNRANSFKS